MRLPSAAWSLKSPEPHAYMRAHRTPARRPYMAGGAARRAWPEESGRGGDRDGVLTFYLTFQLAAVTVERSAAI